MNVSGHTEDEKLGAKIVLSALEEPVKQIARNAGLEPSVILENIKKSDIGIGFDAKEENYVDMKKSGIVDPTKVARSALENAESIVTNKKEEKCKHEHDIPEGINDIY